VYRLYLHLILLTVTLFCFVPHVLHLIAATSARRYRTAIIIANCDNRR